MELQDLKIAFFGTPQIAVWVLEELKLGTILPTLIVTNPDRPQGRGLTLTASEVKQWAEKHTIEVFQPEDLHHTENLTTLTSQEWDLFIVVAYGQIMPKWLIDMPKYGTLNVHPSMLPHLRGASPIRTSILEGYKDTGVSIMLMDEKVDHGPLFAQKAFTITEPTKGSVLDEILAKESGRILCGVIPKWIAGGITPQEQNHKEATFCKKITKDMGELTIDPFNLPQGEAAQQILLKIHAFDGWPGTFFFYEGKRIKITEASIVDNQLLIGKIISEGKREMDFEIYFRK